jgi:hypothetical protein
VLEVRLSGELLDGWDFGGEAVAPQLLFSHPGITATPVLSPEGKPEKDRYVVSVSPEVPPGLHDARMMTALGVSSPRVFTIGTAPETLRTEPNPSVAQAYPLATGMIVNAQVSPQAADHYRLELQKGQAVVIDCAARGIESALVDASGDIAASGPPFVRRHAQQSSAASVRNSR